MIKYNKNIIIDVHINLILRTSENDMSLGCSSLFLLLRTFNDTENINLFIHAPISVIEATVRI